MSIEVTASDGRSLAVCQWGDPAGSTVFSLHGSPGSRLGRHPDEDMYRRAGVRVITYDRAGYGSSTRHPGRRVADAASDVAAIADALGLERFAVTGGSGGGPHALACGALLPNRVTRCASVVGLAPYGVEGLARGRFLEGMVEGNVHEIDWALAGEAVLRPELEREREEMFARIESDSENLLGRDYSLSAADVEVMHDRRIRAMTATSIREGLKHGVDGMVDDDLAFTRPWGFDPAAIAVPVSVWYGRDDTLVPRTHGEWLSRTIPGAEVVVLDGGHFALWERLPEHLAWLTEGSTPG